MSSEDRIEATLASFGAAVPEAERDLTAVVRQGQRYRNRAMFISTFLGVLAAAGAIATTAFLFNAFRSGPEPAEPLPLPTTTTTVFETTAPTTTSTFSPETTSSTTDAPAVLEMPAVLVVGNGMVGVTTDAGVQPLVVGGVRAAFPDGAGGFVFQTVGSRTAAIYWMRAAGDTPSQLSYLNQDEVPILYDVVDVGGSPTVLYGVEHPAADPYYEELRLLHLDDGFEPVWGNIGGPGFGVVSLSSDGALIAADFEEGPGRSVEMWSVNGGQATGVFDPDDNSGGAPCSEGPCQPVLSRDGSHLGYVDGEQTLVVVDMTTGAEVLRRDLAGQPALFDVSEDYALVGSGGELQVVGVASGEVWPIDSAGSEITGASLAQEEIVFVLNSPVQVGDLEPATLEPAATGLPDGTSVLLAHDGGLSLISAEGGSPLLAGVFWNAVPDGDGGVVAATGDSIVWLPAEGEPVEVVVEPALRLLGVVRINDRPSIVYRSGSEIRLVARSAGFDESVWFELPTDIDIWALSQTGSTIGFISSGRGSIVTNFVDEDGNPVEEPFDPEPAEPCFPFDDWCIGDMLLDPAGHGVAYTWVLAGADEESEVRVIDRVTGATSGVVVPHLVALEDFYDGLALASVSAAGSDGLVLIDVAGETVTPIDLPEELGDVHSARLVR